MNDDLGRLMAVSLAEPEAEALQVMRLSLLDWLAVGLPGQDEPVARIVTGMVAEESGAAQATAFGGARRPARAAALVNGTVSHALDYDDTHFAHIGHPSVAVVPAALALAEREGADMARLLQAALQGCEMSVRIGLLLGRGHYQVGYHQTATAGTFGATLAAGVILGLDEAQMRHALGLAATRASGLKAQFGTMGKPYNAGMAASNGVECANLAARGMTSNPAAVVGALGFVETHHGDGAVDDAPGFRMVDVSHKFHACCHGLHATLEAVGLLKPVEPEAVERIEVRVSPRWMTVCNKVAPQSGLEAKFSYGAVIALSLRGYDTGALESFADGVSTRPELMALAERVEVIPDANVGETAAEVAITVAGARREAVFDLTAPMDLAAREARVRGKAAALLGAARAEAGWQAVCGGDLGAFVALMAGR